MAVDADSTPNSVSQSRDTSKRPGEKRLTLALDGETYRRLRRYAAETDQTHQAILEDALVKHLEGNPAPFGAEFGDRIDRLRIEIEDAISRAKVAS